MITAVAWNPPFRRCCRGIIVLDKVLYNGGSALHPHILFEDVFIGSGYLDHVCERDDRFVYCDRICHIAVYFATNPGYDSILAAKLEGKIVLIRAGNIVSDTDLHAIGARHPAVVSESVQDTYPAVQLSAIVFFEINSLNILSIFTVDTFRVSIQRVEGSKELGSSSAIHLGMKKSKVVILVTGAAGYKCSPVFETSG